MNGLTTTQQWTHDHITRCTCGSWTVITEWEAHQLTRGTHPACTHINPAVMEGAAA